MLTNIIFLTPIAFWGLLTIAVPIIIHLFNLRSVKRVDFSHIAFLRKVKEESSAKRKPVELLILCSRVLGLTLLVLAFAQPFLINSDSARDEDKKVVIYLDNSLSGQVEGENGSSIFNDAINKAVAIVEAYPENTTFHFVENAFNNSPVINYTQEGVKDILTELDVVSVDRGLSEIVHRIKGAGIFGEIYLISDFQNKGDLNVISLDTLNSYQIMPLKSVNVNNVFVDSVYLENSYFSGNLSNVLHVRLKRNFKDELNINLKLYSGESLVSTGALSFTDELLKNYAFELSSDMMGLDQLRIDLDDPFVGYDNSFYISLNELDKIRIVEIASASATSYISAIYEKNDLFSFQKMPSQFIDNQLLLEADFVVLNEVEVFSNQLVNALKSFVSNGGSLLVIPGVRNISRLSELGLLVAQDTHEEMELKQPNYANPLFDDVFEINQENIQMPRATTSFRLSNIENSILSFPNGRDFLSKASVEGKVYFLASSLQKNVTNFGVHALFVPIMYKIALGSSAKLSNIYHYTDDGQFSFPRSSDASNGVFELSGNDSRLTPEQRIVNDELIMEVPKGIINAGHYTLSQGEIALGNLAFNVSKKESDLKGLSEDVFTELAKQDHIEWIKEQQLRSFQNALASSITGKPLWTYALLLALFFLFVEVILIRYL